MDKEKYVSAINKLKHASVLELEAMQAEIEGFPFGMDGFINRTWIVNAVTNGSHDTIKWMLSKNIELNHKDDEGLTCLHSCLNRRSVDRYDILNDLIKAGADVNIRGTNDWTPLHLAAISNDRRAMEILLNGGADPTIRTRIDDYATPEEEARILGKKDGANFLASYKRK